MPTLTGLQFYNVRLGEIFEGPLEVLLNLIEARKVEITRVSLAEVTDQFVAHIQKVEIGADALAEFLRVAATLLIIKTKALLPFLAFTEAEEEEMSDLEFRLRLLAQFRAAGKNMRTILRAGSFSFGRDPTRISLTTFLPPRNVSATVLGREFQRIADEFSKFFAKQSYAHKTLQRMVSLEDKIRQLLAAIEARIERRFHEMAGGLESKMEIIVTFLALLELMRQKLISVGQESLFGDIVIKRRS